MKAVASLIWVIGGLFFIGRLFVIADSSPDRVSVISSAAWGVCIGLHAAALIGYAVKR